MKSIKEVNEAIEQGFLAQNGKEELAQGLRVAKGLIILYKYDPELRINGSADGLKNLAVFYDGEEALLKMRKADLIKLGTLGWLLCSDEEYSSCWTVNH